MSAKPKNTAPADEPELPAASAEVPAETPAAPVAEPQVEQQPTFEVGQLVRHVSGKAFKVRGIHPHGIALEGVANLIDPAALSPVQ